MTNREKYKQAFSVLHTSDGFTLEVKEMEKIGKRNRITRMAASIAVCVLLIGGSTMAYAADLGGIQRTVQLWIEGDKTDATLEFHSDGSYEMEYTNQEGNTVSSGGGGVALEPFGKERPLSEEELLELLNDPDVRYEEDGSVWVYYYDQKIDITDKFQDNVCYVKLSNGSETLYMTIEYQNGWSSSPTKYPSPSSFE